MHSHLLGVYRGGPCGCWGALVLTWRGRGATLGAGAFRTLGGVRPGSLSPVFRGFLVWGAVSKGGLGSGGSSGVSLQVRWRGLVTGRPCGVLGAGRASHLLPLFRQLPSPKLGN